MLYLITFEFVIIKYLSIVDIYVKFKIKNLEYTRI